MFVLFTRLRYVLVGVMLSIFWASPTISYADPVFHPLPDDFPSTQGYHKLNLTPYALVNTPEDMRGTPMPPGITGYTFRIQEGVACLWAYWEESITCGTKQLPGYPPPESGKDYEIYLLGRYISDLQAFLAKPYQVDIDPNASGYSLIPTNSLIEVPLYTTADDIKHPAKVTCLYKENEFLACAMQGEVNTVGFKLTPNGQQYWGNNCYQETEHIEKCS